MNRLRTLLIGAFLAAGALAPMAAAGPEHQRPVAMSGTWDVDVTFWVKPGAPGRTSKGTSIDRGRFDGLAIEDKID